MRCKCTQKVLNLNGSPVDRQVERLKHWRHFWLAKSVTRPFDWKLKPPPAIVRDLCRVTERGVRLMKFSHLSWLVVNFCILKKLGGIMRFHSPFPRWRIVPVGICILNEPRASECFKTRPFQFWLVSLVTWEMTCPSIFIGLFTCNFLKNIPLIRIQLFKNFRIFFIKLDL